jgi:5,10-methylenetetrahydromethanopterin reductase
MDIEIILEPDLHPNQVAELAVAAEKYGVRALWSSNFYQQWDAFLSLIPAAQQTSKILLGPLAVSPFEMHPLKMANALLTLNELSDGREFKAVDIKTDPDSDLAVVRLGDAKERQRVV